MFIVPITPMEKMDFSKRMSRFGDEIFAALNQKKQKKLNQNKKSVVFTTLFPFFVF